MEPGRIRFAPEDDVVGETHEPLVREHVGVRRPAPRTQPAPGSSDRVPHRVSLSRRGRGGEVAEERFDVGPGAQEPSEHERHRRDAEVGQLGNARPGGIEVDRALVVRRDGQPGTHAQRGGIAAASRSALRRTSMPTPSSSAGITPIGSHPTPSSAIRRAVAPFALPPNHNGTPPGCTGLGSHHTSRKDTVPALKVTGGCSVHSARHARRASSIRRTRVSYDSPCASNSSRCHPVPTPRSRRPRDSTSSVAAVLASRVAGRNGAMRIPVPNRTRVVAAAIAANVVSGSSHGSSGGYGKVPNG